MKLSLKETLCLCENLARLDNTTIIEVIATMDIIFKGKISKTQNMPTKLYVDVNATRLAPKSRL